MKKIEIIDDDGNVIPPPPASSDVHQLIWLMEYCRRREFLLGPTVQVGSVTAQIVDPALRKKLGNDVGDERTIWQTPGHTEE